MLLEQINQLQSEFVQLQQNADMYKLLHNLLLDYGLRYEVSLTVQQHVDNSLMWVVRFPGGSVIGDTPGRGYGLFLQALEAQILEHHNNDR
jgi:hypothetical protein